MSGKCQYARRDPYGYFQIQCFLDMRAFEMRIRSLALFKSKRKFKTNCSRGCEYADVFSCTAACRARVCNDCCSFGGILCTAFIRYEGEAVAGSYGSVVQPT